MFGQLETVYTRGRHYNLTLMINVPINAITWSLGALALYTFAFKSWLSYRRTRNPIGQMYFLIGLTFGSGLFLFGVPGLLTQDPHILRYTYVLGDFFVQASIQVALWLLWFLGLRNRVRLGYIYMVSVPVSTVLITLEALTSQVSFNQSLNLIVYTDKPVVLILKSIMYICVAMPIGYLMIREVPRQISLRAKFKSLMAGMTFIVVGLAATSNNVFDKGSDTPQSAIIVAVLFLVFLVAQLLRPSGTSS